MEQPLVSVIVPMYNAQNTIRRCVESICGQSYPNLEILLLNDGSKDDTLAVCRTLTQTASWWRSRTTPPARTRATPPLRGIWTMPCS